MIVSKKLNIVVVVAVILALIATAIVFVLGNNPDLQALAKTEPEYASELFGVDIISIEILADEADWQGMLDDAISEQFIVADVIVNGTTFNNVGIRPKGNSSLTHVVSSDSDRYSFRLQFDEYVDGQTCFGLESFVVNNMQGDNSYMKEYLSYDLMKTAGVDCPYFGFADIKLNGEAWGFYLAVEMYNDSYEDRAYNTTAGMLYNVKSMEMGANNGDGNATGNPPERPSGDNMARPTEGVTPQQLSGGAVSIPPDQASNDAIPSSDGAVSVSNGVASTSNGGISAFGGTIASDGAIASDKRGSFKGGGGGMGGERGSTGGTLEYTGDNTASYSAIFSNAVGKSKEADYARVVTALKALSEGENLETYFDVDKTLRYLAAHTVVVNLDSYSSSMAQNYYIYENDGRLTILPWDYNLAWGGFQSHDASTVINFPIDTPVSGVEMSTRPLLEKLFANTKYLSTYHEYLQQLMDEYFADGKLEAKIKELDTLIGEYVKNDATAFCTYDDYQKAVTALTTLGTLRAESVQGQLDGTIPSTTATQTENPEALISAGNLTLNDLGTSMGGGSGRSGEDRNQSMPESNLPTQSGSLPAPPDGLNE